MIIYPPMESMLKSADSRYTLVIVASKRARMLTSGVPKLTDCDSNKDVTIAMNEIYENKVSFHRVHRERNNYENMIETSLNSQEDSV